MCTSSRSSRRELQDAICHYSPGISMCCNVYADWLTAMLSTAVDGRILLKCSCRKHAASFYNPVYVHVVRMVGVQANLNISGTNWLTRFHPAGATTEIVRAGASYMLNCIYRHHHATLLTEQPGTPSTSSTVQRTRCEQPLRLPPRQCLHSASHNTPQASCQHSSTHCMASMHVNSAWHAAPVHPSVEQQHARPRFSPQILSLCTATMRCPIAAPGRTTEPGLALDTLLQS
jgi:hypothetical protein